RFPMLDGLLTIGLAIALGVEPAPCDLVIENAIIWSDGLVAPATFAAIDDGRFVHVGAPDAAWIGPATERLDAGGCTVVPGLIDAWVNLVEAGRAERRLDLGAASDPDALFAAVAAHAATRPGDDWIVGINWSTVGWAHERDLTKYRLDPITGDHPTVLFSRDGRRAVANSAALRRAGITGGDQADPDGGIIERNPENNDATGLLIEAAADVLRAAIPRDAAADREGVRRALDELAALGVTTVIDRSDLADLGVFEDLARADVALPVRVCLAPMSDDWAKAVERVASFPSRADRITMLGLGARVDGRLESGGALMDKSYESDARFDVREIGTPTAYARSGRLDADAALVDAAGLRPMFVASGSMAVNGALNTASSLPRGATVGPVQIALPADKRRFASSGAAACLVPAQFGDVGRVIESIVGPRRAHWCYPVRSLLDAGVVVTFGSDWPSNPPSPFRGMGVVVTSRCEDGLFRQEHESIPVAEALRSYTSRPAWLIGRDGDLGRIAVGARADFVVLGESPFGGGPDWDHLRPLMVYRDGRALGTAGTRHDRETDR
ncbi:MAG: amidohydrolase family protein, partial [Phycisphaerales bacterium]|nr:amidohydrolase family protein [Phycisphaerales bacterium]